MPSRHLIVSVPTPLHAPMRFTARRAKGRKSMQVAAAEYAEVIKFRFDTPITASDGEAGRLALVITDAEQRTITHIGVRIGLFARRHTYYIPLDFVTDGNADGVSLSLSLDEIEQQPIATPTGVALSSTTSVVASGKTLGKLVQLTINRETRVLRHLVIEHGLRREVLVPATLIKNISARQIAVELGGLRPNDLLPFRRDADLYQEIHDAIYNYEPLRIDLPGIEIHAIDGAVWLFGHVSSDLNVRLVEDQLQGVEGLGEIHNDLVSDNALAAAVSMALARDPRTAGEHIGVYPELGVVKLRGSVHSESARTAADVVAASVHGVASVSNDLHVDPRTSVVPVLAGVTNEEDMIPGGS